MLGLLSYSSKILYSRSTGLVELYEVKLSLAWRGQVGLAWLGRADLLVAATTGMLDNDREGFLCYYFYLYPFSKKRARFSVYGLKRGSQPFA